MFLFLPFWFWVTLGALTTFYLTKFEQKTDFLYLFQAILTISLSFIFARKKYYILSAGLICLLAADLSYYIQIYKFKSDSNSLTFYLTSSFLYSSGFVLISKSIFDRVKSSLKIFLIFKLSLVPIFILIAASISFLFFPLYSNYINGSFNYNNLSTITELTTSLPLIILSYLAIILAIDLRDACFSIGILLIGLVDWGIQFEYLTKGSLPFSYYDFFWVFGFLLISLKAFSDSPITNFESPKGASLRARLKILILTASLLPVCGYYFLSRGELKLSISFFLIGTAISLLVASIVDLYFSNQLNILTKEIEQIFSLPTVESYQKTDKKISDEWEESLKIVLKNKVFQENAQKLKENSMLQKKAELSAQVAHDIRSPLTALNVAIDSLDTLSEDRRILIRNAIQRINDIANDLLSQSQSSHDSISINENTKNEDGSHSMSTVMLSSIIDILISEKRTQYRDKIGIQIDTDLSCSYGLFANLPANEFKRALSNLINNSVEALESSRGTIFLRVQDSGSFAKIDITDSGSGIPKHVMDRLGSSGVSFGKEGTTSGSGLGILHAFKFISSIEGRISFHSDPSFANGTTVTLQIPKCPPPSWFVHKLKIPLKGNIVVVDDDQSIHSVWQGRLLSQNSNEQSINFISFTSAEIFKDWTKKQKSSFSETVFLIDYELLGQKILGLDLIEELKIQRNSILVSSRYHEKNVFERCDRLGVQIIPKAMAGLVPIEYVNSKSQFDAILIDDDSLVHMTWSISSKENDKKVLCFKTFEEFLSSTNLISIDTPIVVDVQLGDGIEGDKIAQKIHEMGYRNIFLGTGSSSSNITKALWIKGIIGKAPDWNRFL